MYTCVVLYRVLQDLETDVYTCVVLCRVLQDLETDVYTCVVLYRVLQDLETDMYTCVVLYRVLQDLETDVYTLTLRTHARALAGGAHLYEAREGMGKLKNRATRREGLLYWQNSGNGRWAYYRETRLGVFWGLTAS